MRLDAYLAENYPDFSRSTLQKFISDGKVTVNGLVASSSSKRIQEDDKVELSLPKEISFVADNKEFENRVLYEDENVVVVDKPVGFLTHAKGPISEEFTVADFVRTRIKTADEDFLATNRPGIVHRLDRATSGVLIAAKNADTQKFLQKQFAERKAHKVYLAIVEGKPKLEAATIDLPIARNPKQPSSFRIDPKGKPATTNYRVLKHLNSKLTLLELKPLTGRTHQLRVHLAYIGTPILGDPVYGSGQHSDRMFLHAKSLEITIPSKPENARKTFTSELPADFQDKIKEVEHDTNN